MVRQVGPGARIIRLLGFPGDDAALDVDFPRAGAGTVHTMGGADNLVVLPALAIGVFPVTVLIGRDAMTFREGADILPRKKIQAIEE